MLEWLLMIVIPLILLVVAIVALVRVDGGTFIVLLFFFVLWILGVGVYVVATKDFVCTSQGRVETLVSAVGRSSVSKYVYRMEGGGYWEASDSHIDGDVVCMGYGWVSKGGR